VPIIALTANAVSGMRYMFLEKGFSDFLAKPIDVSKLDEILDRWIPKEKREEKREEGESKREKVEGRNETGLDNCSFLPATLYLIPGVDTQKGIAMTGGTTDGYRAVLSLFCKDAEDRLPLLQSPPDADALLRFVTQVHAMKSAAASIGAAELSVIAEKLEAAGKAGDLAFIEKNLGSFTEQLAELVKNIRAALETLTPAAEAQVSAPSLLPSPFSLFTALKAALEAKNVVELDRIIDELIQKAPDSKTKELLEQISDHVLMAEYDDAVKILDSLLEREKERGP